MAQTHRYGSRANGQQGTQEPSLAKRKPASAFGRTSQRSAPRGNTTFNPIEDRKDKDRRDKKYSHGKYSKQVLFP